MALIGTIRKNSWLLILTIGLALAAFIIMDMSAGDKSIFGSSQNIAGTIEGEKVDWGEFNRAENILYANSGGDVFARRASLWDYFVEDKLVRKEAEAMGLGVGKQELLDLQFSQDNRKLSPLILQRYTNPSTGQIDRQQLTEIKTAIETRNITNPDFKTRWGYQEKEIIKTSMQSKLETLVSKAIYTPSWMAEMMYNNDEQKVDFQYVKVPFDNIDDGKVTLTDADYTSYMKENSALYRQDEETRKVDYAVFEVKPTAQDESKIRNSMSTLLPDFASTTNDSAFVENNYGTISGAYQKKSTLNNLYADTLFNVAPGSVVGPYKDGNSFVAIKVIDRKVVPDSVRSRHILIQGTDQASFARGFQLLDSLKLVIEAGTERFDSLAVKFSQGPSNVKGGDLGFAGPNAMVAPFNDLIFYKAKKNELNIIATQFGLHLVEVTDYKYLTNEEGVKIAMLRQNIIPSEETISAINNKALEFVSNNRSVTEMVTAAQADPSIIIETSPPVKASDYILGTLGSGQTSRDIIKWAFENGSVDETSSQVYIYQNDADFYDEKFVIAGLRAVQPAGMPSVDFVKSDIETQVRNYKKGQMLLEQIKGKDLNAVASTFAGTVETATDLSFTSSAIPGAGAEPKVIASAFSLAENQASAPIIGNGGVYVIKPTRKTTVGAATNLIDVKKKTNTAMRNQVRGQIVEGLKNNAEITDNRSRVY